MAEIKIVTISESELRELIRQEVNIAIKDALAEHNDELVTIKQICEKIPGMTRYIFKQLEATTKLKNFKGKYSLLAVKHALRKEKHAYQR